MPRPSSFRPVYRSLLLVALVSPGLAACSGGSAGGLGSLGETYTHGYVMPEDALSQIQVGSSREQVLLVMGTPSTTSTIDGEIFYYISQKTSRAAAFMKPELVDQRVFAVYFDNKGKVKELANYGLQDGKVFDFINKRTKTAGKDVGFIGQMFRGGTDFGPSLPISK